MLAVVVVLLGALVTVAVLSGQALDDGALLANSRAQTEELMAMLKTTTAALNKTTAALRQGTQDLNWCMTELRAHVVTTPRAEVKK